MKAGYDLVNRTSYVQYICENTGLGHALRITTLFQIISGVMLGNLHEREVSPFTTLILTIPPRLPFSLPDRYEQMFTPQLRSRYWLRRRRRRNDKSFRKWRRASDTRVERGRQSLRRSQLPFLSLTRHSPGRGERARDATKRRHKCAQLITIRVKYLCDR